MSEETQEVSELAETPAPEQAATAAPESENITPEEKSAELSKVFSQEEVDALIGKRLAREQRKWERQQQALKVQQPAMSAELPTAA
jgi:hypothetical protein